MVKFKSKNGARYQKNTVYLIEVQHGISGQPFVQSEHYQYLVNLLSKHLEV